MLCFFVERVFVRLLLPLGGEPIAQIMPPAWLSSLSQFRAEVLD